MFTSKANRDPAFKNLENPAPGTYNIVGDISHKTSISGTGNPLMAGIGDSKKREAGFNTK